MNIPEIPCYCCSNKNFETCCAPYLNKSVYPDTPEALMRSRYSAFVLKDITYIEETMRGKALQKADLEQTRLWLDCVDWKGLRVIESKKLGSDTGLVHFIAEYEQASILKMLEEKSEFKRINQRWFYVKGKQLNSSNTEQKKPQIGRNEPCSCGSGKKSKHCCY